MWDIKEPFLLSLGIESLVIGQGKGRLSLLIGGPGSWLSRRFLGESCNFRFSHSPDL